jgi:hypothetical protein
MKLLVLVLLIGCITEKSKIVSYCFRSKPFSTNHLQLYHGTIHSLYMDIAYLSCGTDWA